MTTYSNDCPKCGNEVLLDCDHSLKWDGWECEHDLTHDCDAELCITVDKYEHGTSVTWTNEE